MVEPRRGPENLPDSPGVYLFRGDRGKILYVGKALSLRKRVASYFNPAGGGAKEEALRRFHREVETISTRTELEALLLENTLIKKHRPKYNVCLRDDKTYPYIKVTTGEDWPRALVTRRVEEDGHSYYGPFWGGLARRIMRMITRHFQIRTCTIEIDGKLPRPCLYYDLHACLGPCVAGLTTKETYRSAVRRRRALPRGAQPRARGEPEREDADLVRGRELRDGRGLPGRAPHGPRRVGEPGRPVAPRRERGRVRILRIRAGRCDLRSRRPRGILQDRRDFFFEKAQELDPAAFLEAFLPQFYDANPFLPSEVHLPVAIADAKLVEDYVLARRNARIAVRTPQRGDAADRVRMAETNARERHRVRFRRTAGDEAVAVEKLARALGLGIPPRRIEAFDISHTQGTDSVASLVVFEEGKAKKSDYRLFNIESQSLLEPDDFRSMAEAVDRRYRRLQSEGSPMPDLILIDGGRGQLQAALTALDRLGLDLPAVGLAKREEEIWAPGRPEPIRLSKKDPALQLVQRVRDEAHRFAISRHRQRRGKRMRQTGLTEIPGIGPVRARLLLRRFGSVKGLRGADPREIAAAVGPTTARAVAAYLGSNQGAAGA